MKKQPKRGTRGLARGSASPLEASARFVEAPRSIKKRRGIPTTSHREVEGEWSGTERRAKSAKPRKLNERRRDMLILSSATQADIYLWALSLIVAGCILTGLLLTSVIGIW